MKFLAPSDFSNCTMRDGHSYSFTKPANRLKAPAYGRADRTIGQTVDVTCASCIADFQEPRHGFASRIQDVQPTQAEAEYVLGKAQSRKSTVESLMAQLAELDA